MKRKLILFSLGAIAITIISILCIFYYKNQTKEIIEIYGSDDKSMKVALYRGGAMDATYYFVVKHDGTLEISYGYRDNNDIKSGSFLYEIIEKERIKLTDKQLEILLNLAVNIEENSDKLMKFPVFDGSDTFIYYNDLIYDLNYSGAPLDFVPNLVNKLIEYSGIEVDLLYNWRTH